ncbi:MAG TPA: ABC transporter permease, partial [Blastocatellia bacterium]|nr:ABC transporter permease [Blastocatellia bacterium]
MKDLMAGSNDKRERSLRSHLWLIGVIGVIVPRRLRGDWRQEWEAELRNRELLLAEWDRLDWTTKIDLLRRSIGAFWDALCLQPRRLEDEMFQDLRYGIRMLLKNRSFTIVAVLTLGLGIGANTAIFSVVNAMILRPLPFPDSERLVWVEEVSRQTNDSQPAWGGHFLAWQEQSQSLSGITAIDSGTRTLTGAGEPERLEVGQLSAGCLPMLGVQLLAGGRNFTATEDSPGGERVAILSYGLWQRRFGGDPNIVGKPITLNDADFTVIGVLPANFHFFYRFDVLLPLALDPRRELGGESRYYGTTVARLKPGVSTEQAQAEMDSVQQRYEVTRPEGRPRIDCRTRLVPLHEYFLGERGERRRALLVLFGAVALVLLIACANVANLLLARGAVRQKELAIRAALGAGRLRLMRQMLTECLVLALAGGAAGLLLASWLTSLLGSLDSAETFGEIGRLATITIDGRVLGFTLLVSLVTGLLFGLVPALRISRPDLNVSLKEGGHGSGLHGRRLRGVLMVSEVALALVLLISAGLLMRSFAKLLDVDPGYRAENLLTARVALPPRYRDNAQRVLFYDRILERLSALPGVSAVGATSHLPLTGYNMGANLVVQGQTPLEGENPPSAPVARVNPDYFHAMGIALRSGRLFNDGDAEGAPNVAVLSESLARRLFPNEDPLGKRLSVGGDRITTIIGVVNDIRYRGLDGEIEQAVYLPYRQLPRSGMALVLRGTGEATSLAAALRSAVRDVDPALPVYDVMTMNQRLSNSVAARRFNLMLLGGFAALSLVLAGVGVYGVISYVVTERTHEVGIRMALGAQSGDVARLFVKQGMRLVTLGVALGILGAIVLTRLMTGLLFNVSATDPFTFAAVGLLLSLIALLACYVPAKRAARVD